MVITENGNFSDHSQAKNYSTLSESLFEKSILIQLFFKNVLRDNTEFYGVLRKENIQAEPAQRWAGRNSFETLHIIYGIFRGKISSKSDNIWPSYRVKHTPYTLLWDPLRYLAVKYGRTPQ